MAKTKQERNMVKKNLELTSSTVVINDPLINWGGKCRLLYIDIHLFIISNKAISIFKLNL